MDHYGEIVKNPYPYKRRFLMCTPSLGTVRMEWVLARYGQVVPCNWSMTEMQVWLDYLTPMGFGIPDARNICVQRAIETGTEWIFFLDSDVILPAGTLLKLNRYMCEPEAPIVSGVYFTKGIPSDPVIYRGRGNGYFADWKLGDKVWVDGTGMGVTLIHMSVMREVYEDSEEYVAGNVKCRKVFGNPEVNESDGKDCFISKTGTEDLPFYTKVKDGGYYERAGWPEIQAMEYPLLVDTSIMCKHINANGAQYPMNGEEHRFMTEVQLRALAGRSRR